MAASRVGVTGVLVVYTIIMKCVNCVCAAYMFWSLAVAFPHLLIDWKGGVERNWANE